MVLQEGSWFYQASPLQGASAHTALTYHSQFSHRKKREAKIKRDVKRGIREANDQNPFEIFVTVTDIRYTCVHTNARMLLRADLPCLHVVITRNLTRFLEIHTECVYYKISRPSHPTC